MTDIVCTHGRGPLEVPPHGYGQRGRYALPDKVTDRNGKPCCRWCLGSVEHPRRTWCSDVCVAEGRLRLFWDAICEVIRERDGVCVLCGGCRSWQASCAGFGGLRRHCCTRPPYWWTDGDPATEPIRWACRIRPLYEVDHIVPVVEGGTDDPANLRLLCRACHLDVTREWRAGRSVARREQAAIESGCGVQARLLS